jgi:hypothetical protein
LIAVDAPSFFLRCGTLTIDAPAPAQHPPRVQVQEAHRLKEQAPVPKDFKGEERR